MLNSMIIGGDTEAGAYLRQVCGDFADICIYKVLNTGSRLHEVIVALNKYDLDVVFLDVTGIEREDSFAYACLQELIVRHPQTAVVPYCKRTPSVSLEELASLGPVLTPPFSAEQLERMVRGALRARRPSTKQTSTMLAFLPSKPGAGASTMALHVAAAAVSSHGKQTLLVEADIGSGSIAYVLGLQSQNPAGGAIESYQLSDAQWSRCIDKSHGFDILPVWGGPNTIRGTRWDYYRLLQFARERYDVVIVDMPETIDEISESIIAEADKAVMVSTPETSSLSLVRRRMWELEAHGAFHAHIQLAVNRYVAGDPDVFEMGRIAHSAVTVTFPEDFHAMKAASRRHGLVASNCKFWRGVVAFTRDLLEVEAVEKSSSAFGFLKKTVGNLFGGAEAGVLAAGTRVRGGAK